MATTSVITMICGSLCIFKKIAHHNQVQQLGVNNHAKNKSIMGSIGMISISSLILLTLLLFAAPSFADTSLRNYLPLYTIIYAIPSLVFPIGFFANNPKIIKTTVALFLEALRLNWIIKYTFNFSRFSALKYFKQRHPHLSIRVKVKLWLIMERNITMKITQPSHKNCHEASTSTIDFFFNLILKF